MSERVNHTKCGANPSPDSLNSNPAITDQTNTLSVKFTSTSSWLSYITYTSQGGWGGV